MNIVEPLADAVTGGVVASAAEPDTGVDATGHTTEQACLNCGTPLVGTYCHACGQRGHVHRSLAAFGHDLLHGVFHFEGKVWRTVPMLLFHPGQLTRRYIAGERARFVSPVALFLFTVFLMFAVVSWLGGPIHIGNTNVDTKGLEEANRDFTQQRQADLEALDIMREQRADLQRQGASTADLDRKIAEQERSLRVQKELFDTATSVVSGEAKPDSGDANFTVVSGADGVNDWFNQAYKKAKKNPSLLFYKLQNNGYKYSWALIPLSVPFVWLLFLHRRRYWQYRAYDHTVFVTYSITFMSVGFILLTLLRPLGLPGGISIAAMTILPPIHIYKQLRGAYLLSRFSALWRTLALLVFASIAASLFAMLLLVLGVLS